MTAYLVEVDDTKQGVCYPNIVGPFSDEESAATFAAELAMGRAAEGGQGGYSAVHVVSDGTCDYTPAAYREAYAWRLDESEAVS